MQFSAEAIEAILEGRKTRTTRPQRRIDGGPFYEPVCPWHVGGSYAVQPGRGKFAIARICVIVHWRYPTVFAVIERDPEHARLEGFANAHEFLDRWHALYRVGDYRRIAPVWVIDFTLITDSEARHDGS